MLFPRALPSMGIIKLSGDLYEKVLKDLKEANPDTPTGKLEDEANKKVADEFSLAPETIDTAVNTEMITVASKVSVFG